MHLLFNAVGDVGMVCFLGAYFLLQRGRMSVDSYAYSAVNLLGSVLLMISLLHDWNMPAFLLEVAWAVISTYGLLRCYRGHA